MVDWRAVRAIAYRLRAWAGRRWASATGLALVVALALAVVLAILAGAHRTLTAPDRYAERWDTGVDAAIEQASGRPRTDELTGLPSVERASAASFVFGAVLDDDGTPFDSLLFAGSPEPLGLQLVDGRLPEAPEELVASTSFFETTGAAVGDRLELVTLTQEQADTLGFDAPEPGGPSFEVTIVGALAGPADIESGAYPVSLPLPRPSTRAMSAWRPPSCRSSSPPVRPSRTSAANAAGLPRAEELAIDRAQVVHDDIRDAVDAQGQGLLILGLVIAGATVAVVGQIATRQLRLADDEIATLRALGSTRGQLVAEQTVRATMVVAAAAVAGAILAWSGSGLFPTGFAERVEPDGGLRFDPLVHLAAAAGLALARGGVGRRRADAHHHPTGRGADCAHEGRSARALAPECTGDDCAPVRVRHTDRSDTSGSRATRRAGRGVRRALRRRHVRSEPAAIGRRSRRMGGGLRPRARRGPDEFSPEVVDALEADPNVDAVTLYGATQLLVETRTLDVIGMQPVAGNLVPEVLDGRLPVGADEVALGPRAARTFDVEIGDELTGSAATGEHTLTVTGIALIPGIGGSDLLGQNALVTDGGYRALDPEGPTFQVVVRLAPDAPADAADQIAASTGLAAGGLDPPAAITSLDRVRDIPDIVAAAVGALGVLSLGHLMLVGVHRRRRDFAVLRSLGATRGRATQVVHWQATATTALVLGAGMPLGVLAGASLYQRFVHNVGARPDAVLPLGRTALALVVLALLANVVAAVAARRVRRDPPALVLAAG